MRVRVRGRVRERRGWEGFGGGLGEVTAPLLHSKCLSAREISI